MSSMGRAVATTLVAAALVVSACSGTKEDGRAATETTIPPEVQAQDEAERTSLVVIGDSVAAGEGIAYGYKYDYVASEPDSSGWTGGESDPKWQGEYQLCHQDERAYGELLAKALDANLAKFACTGATYLNGITSR